MKLEKGLNGVGPIFCPRPRGTGPVHWLRAAGQPMPGRHAGRASMRSPRSGHAGNGAVAHLPRARRRPQPEKVFTAATSAAMGLCQAK
jgi:hypothetical protein